MNMAQLIIDMSKCPQFPNFSILQHGFDCADRLSDLLTGDT